MRLLRCMAVAILLGMLLETQSVFAYGGIPVRYYDEVLVMVANGENNSGPPHLLLDTTSIVVQKMRDQYGVKYSFIAYFYKDGKVDTSNPDLFELWALKNSTPLILDEKGRAGKRIIWANFSAKVVMYEVRDMQQMRRTVE